MTWSNFCGLRKNNSPMSRLPEPATHGPSRFPRHRYAQPTRGILRNRNISQQSQPPLRQLSTFYPYYSQAPWFPVPNAPVPPESHSIPRSVSRSSHHSWVPQACYPPSSVVVQVHLPPMTFAHPTAVSTPSDRTWSSGAWTSSRTAPIQLCPLVMSIPSASHSPQIIWDISQHPISAKRLTSRGVIVDLASKFKEPITFNKSETVLILCGVGPSRLWNPIGIQKSSAVTIWDILFAIYEHFQKQLTPSEVNLLRLAHPDNYRHMCQTYWRRCQDGPGLSAFEQLQGLKRVDCLGDCKFFLSLQVLYNADRTWRLNLDLNH